MVKKYQMGQIITMYYNTDNILELPDTWGTDLVLFTAFV